MIFLGLLLVGLLVGASLLYGMSLWTRRTLSFWLSKIKRRPVKVPLWLSFLVTLIFNGITLGLNVISEVARLLVKQK